MNMYPFTSVLDIMKPCKINSEKTSHTNKLKECLHSPNYIWEEKLDGISILAIGGRLYSNKISKKTGWPSEKTLRLPQIALPLQQVSPYLLLDGEAYRPGWKSNDVTSITNSDVPIALAKQAERGNLQYHVYDMLRDIDGTWMVSMPFAQRRARLEKLFATNAILRTTSDIVLNPVHECTEQDPEVALAEILSKGLEGIVLKDKKGMYYPGKRPMWVQIKLKASFEDDVVICGFEPATRKYTGKNLETWPYWEEGEPVTENYIKGLIGSIKIGKYDSNGTLVPVGRVTGITDALRYDMTTNPNKYIGRVIIIKGMEKTEDGKYRHANFHSFHPDKNAKECRINEND